MIPLRPRPMLEEALLATFARWDEVDYKNGIAIQVP
jgi:hypothetical protein